MVDLTEDKVALATRGPFASQTRYPNKANDKIPDPVTNHDATQNGSREDFKQISKTSPQPPSRGSTFVPMMQPANLRHCYHSPQLRPLHRTTLRRVLLQRQMCARDVIVVQKELQLPTQ